ncbi:MAG: DinB family protein [Dissulfurispiraceae bacterium]|jgi:hypothetical protein
MSTAEATRLVRLIREKTGELKDVCKGIDEDTASRAPEGRWSPKQILSHLCGPEGKGFMASIRAFLEQETPRLDIEPENHFYTDKRAAMTMAQMLANLDGEYGRIAELTAGLTEEQLSRKAHIPLVKDTPMGEYPTLAMWIQAIAEYHVSFHIDHMREILKELGKAQGSRR